MLHNNSHSYEFGPYRLDVDQRDSFDCQPNHLDNGESIDEWKLPRQVLSGALYRRAVTGSRCD